MDTSNIIASCALFVSFLSLGYTTYIGFRDSGRIKAKSEYFPESEYGPAGINITVTNHGRRAVIFRLFAGEDDEGKSSGEILGREGLRLPEHGRHERSITKDNIIDAVPGPEVIEFTNFWFEDNLGKRYKIKNIKRNVMKLRNS